MIYAQLYFGIWLTECYKLEEFKKTKYLKLSKCLNPERTIKDFG